LKLLKIIYYSYRILFVTALSLLMAARVLKKITGSGKPEAVEEHES
jgi:hypothetical protein